MERNTQLMIAGAAAGTALGIALNWSHIKRLFNNSGDAEDGNPFPLYPSGQYSPLVQQVQQAMLQHPLARNIIQSTGGADGIYGDGTKEALQVMLFNPSRIAKQDYDRILEQAGMSGLGCLCQLDTPEGWLAPFNLTVRHLDGNTESISKGRLLGKFLGAKGGIAVFSRSGSPIAFKYR